MYHEDFQMQRLRTLSIALASGLLFAALAAAAQSTAPAAGGAVRVLRVGPNLPLKTPSAAARLARDGDLVEIEGGDYRGDVAVWTQNRLRLRGVQGRPHLRADGNAAEGKAIWVIKGDDVEVDNIEFSGTRVRDLNGAGIRAEGAGLTIRGSSFHDNENGILTNHNPNSVLRISDSEFHHNIVDYARTGRLGHNIYVGNIRGFSLRNSQVYGAVTGHQVKSRARRNEIVGNRIRDADGGSSYLIDIPDGGEATITDNTLEQSARAPNRTAIAFAAEANRNAPFGESLTVIGNRFTNEGTPAVFVHNHSPTLPARLRGNLLNGPIRAALQGPGSVE